MAEHAPLDLGPAILQCGDLHLENFGAYQTDDGEFRFDINDFDEALVAPCSLDLVPRDDQHAAGRRSVEDFGRAGDLHRA